MKKISTILIALIVFYNCKAQNTTEEEYNWITKGYQTMVSSGLDMKKGYYFQDQAEFSKSFQDYNFTYKLLKRENDKSIAGTLVIAHSKVSGRTYYYCIPALNYNGSSYSYSSYMAQFYKSVWELDGIMTDCFFASLSFYYASLSTYYFSGK